MFFYYRVQYDVRTRRVRVSHVITLRVQLYIIFLYSCTQPENGLTLPKRVAGCGLYVINKCCIRRLVIGLCLSLSLYTHTHTHTHIHKHIHIHTLYILYTLYIYIKYSDTSANELPC